MASSGKGISVTDMKEEGELHATERVE